MPLQSMAGGEAIQPCLTSSPFMVSSSSLPAHTPAHGQQRPNLPGYIGGTDGFIAKATQYTDITELTPELLRLFIQKIAVHEESVKYSKHSEQTVEIHYTDIGYIGGKPIRARKTPAGNLSAIPAGEFPKS